MGLFHLEQDQIVLTKDIKRIKVFKEILERDNADDILAYVYHKCDWSSPYADMLDDEREEELRKDFLNGKAPTKQIKEACDKYVKLSETASLQLLQSARKGARSLQEYFETIDPAESDNPGREAKDLMANLTKVGDLLNKFDEWEDILKKEQDKANTRKGVKLSKYNEG